jgi:hypothetical protein
MKFLIIRLLNKFFFPKYYLRKFKYGKYGKLGSKSISGIVYFENSPPKVVQIVKDDVRGVTFPRLISFFWA